jgi:hypothetical protein
MTAPARAYGYRMTQNGEGADRPPRNSGPRAIGHVGPASFFAFTEDAVVPWVDIAIHCMFARERGDAQPSGRVYEVDRALGGALVRLRGDGFFGGAVGEVLTLSSVPAQIGASKLVVIGLGEPDHWTPAVMAEASARAMVEVLRAGVASASFTPCFADWIGDRDAVELAYGQIGIGAVRALEDALASDGAARGVGALLERWIFDLKGAEPLEAVSAVSAAFDRRSSSR